MENTYVVSAGHVNLGENTKGEYAMIYKYNETVSPIALSDLREAVGWNRMEKEYENPLMTSYYHIAVYEKKY